MNLRRVCLAALVLMPWPAVAGAVVVAHELLVGHGVRWVLAGCAALVVAFEASAAAYKSLEARPAVSRAEAVRRLAECGWWLSRSGLGPPSEP
jgi:hypothetical protein